MKNVAIFGVSGNPPTRVHQLIVDALGRPLSEDFSFDRVELSICGPRDDKGSSLLLPPHHRAAMAILGFPNLPLHVSLDIADLSRMAQRVCTSTYRQLTSMQAGYSSAMVWFVVGADLVEGGREASQIYTQWTDGPKLWEEFAFVLVPRPGHQLPPREQCPPRSIELPVDLPGKSSDVRVAIKAGRSISDMVLPAVEQYINVHGLYRE